MKERIFTNGIVAIVVWCNIFKVILPAISMEGLGDYGQCLECKKYNGQITPVYPKIRRQRCHRKDLTDFFSYKTNPNHIYTCKKPTSQIVTSNFQPVDFDILDEEKMEKENGQILESTDNESWLSYIYRLSLGSFHEIDRCVECVQKNQVLTIVPTGLPKLEKFKVVIFGSYVDQNFKSNMCQHNFVSSKILHFPENMTLLQNDYLDRLDPLRNVSSLSKDISKHNESQHDESVGLLNRPLNKEKWYYLISSWLKLLCPIPISQDRQVAYNTRVNFLFEDWYYSFTRTLRLKSPNHMVRFSSADYDFVEWYYSFLRSFKLKTPNKPYMEKFKMEIEREDWWKSFLWLIRLSSLRNRVAFKAISDEDYQYEIWRRKFIFSLKLFCKTGKRLDSIYEEWYYNFLNIFKFQTLNKHYLKKIRKGTDMHNWWNTISWYMKINSVKAYAKSKVLSDEHYRMWHVKFMFSLKLFCNNTRRSSDSVFEEWYYDFFRMFKLRTPNSFYLKKLQRDYELEEWWRDFSWLLKLNSVKSSVISKDEQYRTWYHKFMLSLKLHCNINQLYVDIMYEEWYYRFCRIFKLRSPNVRYRDKLQMDDKKEKWWKAFSSLLNVNSLKTSPLRGDEIDEHYRIWYQRFIFAFQLYCIDEQQNLTNMYEKWYYNFIRMLQLQTSNELYLEKLRRNVKMENWWRRFSWILIVSNAKMLGRTKSNTLSSIDTVEKDIPRTVRDVDMEEWWLRFAWLMKLRSARSSVNVTIKTTAKIFEPDTNEDLPESGIMTQKKQILPGYGGEVDTSVAIVIVYIVLLVALLKAGMKQLFNRDQIKDYPTNLREVKVDESPIVPTTLTELSGFDWPKDFQDALSMSDLPSALPSMLSTPAAVLAARRNIELDLMIAVVDIYPWSSLDCEL